MSSRGQVVIPRQVRERVGLQPGDEVSVQALDGATLVAEGAEATEFELAVARLQGDFERRGITEADIERALEEVKAELYEERYGQLSRQHQAVS
jgi:AbrB family looped-hinge helix DNA binding protein